MYPRTRIETALSLTETEEHYRDQLLAVGWELLRVGEGPATAWSTWLVTEEGFLGRLWVGMLEVRYANLHSDFTEDDGEIGDSVTLSVSLQVVTSEEEP